MRLSKTTPDEHQQVVWLISAGLLGLTAAILAFATTKFLIGYLCLLLCGAFALILHLIFVVRAQPRQPELLQILLDLSSDRELAKVHSSLASALRNIASRTDPIFRQLADYRLNADLRECQLLGDGRVEFPSTESWRVVYEELLRSPGLYLYRSVAYIETAHYWQDGPGQQSTKLNVDLQDGGVINIERIAIIADHLWEQPSLFPVEPLHSWLEQQHRYGIWIGLVRESLLENDTDLLCDIGIYGSRAVGMQTADPAGRTIRFVLDFNFPKIQEAEARWNRLAVYAVPFRELLEQQH
jgi:hypothetical protein